MKHRNDRANRILREGEGRVRLHVAKVLELRTVRRLFALLFVPVFLGVLSALSPGSSDAATAFTVNRTGDSSDRNITDSVCDVSSNTGRQCTLRAAIQEANDTPNSGGPDLINFKIGGTAPVKTISPASPLPPINRPAFIDGYSQPGASPNNDPSATDTILKIELSGAKAGSSFDGLKITAPNSTIKGLAIDSFDQYGILVQGVGASNNKIEGNYIGTDISGTQDLGNSWRGVYIQGAPNNTIGGTLPAQRNVISGTTIVVSRSRTLVPLATGCKATT